MEGGPWLEAQRITSVVRRQSATFQSLSPSRTTRQAVELQNPHRSAELPAGLVQSIAMATAAGNGETRRFSSPAFRRDRRLLRPSGPLWRGGIPEHDDQGHYSSSPWHAR